MGKLDNDKELLISFTSDEYKYKTQRCREICRLILKCVGMINAVAGGVITVVSAFL